MNPETRDFLDAVRAAEDPNAEDERRVLSAVRAAIATGAVAGAGLGVSKAAKLLGGGAAAGVKVGGLVLGLSAAAWIAVTAFSPEPLAPPSAVVARVPSSRPSQSLPPPTLPPVPDTTFRTPRQQTPNAVQSARPPTRSSAGAASTTSSLRGELALLAEVQAALARGDGATALQKLDERPSTDRRLLAERRAARILALCSLGRTPEAARSASTFFREHPTSVQRSAVERSCAGKADEPR